MTTQYVLALHHGQEPGDIPDNIEQIMAEVTAFDQELRAAGKWVWAGGLAPAFSSTVVHHTNGETVVTDGPYIEAKESLGGFTIMEATDLDDALAWGAKFSKASGLPVEVRPVQQGA
jgi:hypothetical protein